MRWPVETNELTSVRDAIGDLPPVPGGQRSERIAYAPRPGAGSQFQERMRQGVAQDEREWLYDHITRAVRVDDWEAYTGLEEGQTYADIPEHLQRYRTDIFTDKYKRLAWQELSRTITAHIAKDGYWYIHPEQHRTLSIREAARLQTFPDWFRFAGQPSHRYAQIGNAVPPFVGEAVGRALRQSLRTDARPAELNSDARGRLVDWAARLEPHAWRRPGMEPWLVLAAELGLDRLQSHESYQRFEALLELAPEPQALARLDDPVAALGATGFSPHAARLVVGAAEAVMELFDGRVPDEDLELRAIPGVGDSAAKTVLCFGHDRKVVPLHSAAARVATRFFGTEHRRRWQLRLDLHRLAGPEGPDASFNAAVLELGARLCTATEPNCSVCPLQDACVTGRARAARASNPLPNESRTQ